MWPPWDCDWVSCPFSGSSGKAGWIKRPLLSPVSMAWEGLQEETDMQGLLLNSILAARVTLEMTLGHNSPRLKTTQVCSGVAAHTTEKQ